MNNAFRRRHERREQLMKACGSGKKIVKKNADAPKLERKGMSEMVCTKCNREVGDCECPGQDAQLRELAMDPEANLAFKWCRKCDKHYARCRCEQQDFYVLCGGKELRGLRLPA